MIRAGVLIAVLSAFGCAGSSSRPAEFSGDIAYIGQGNRVFTIDAADSTVTRIGQRTSVDPPSWSPDRATIAYSTPNAQIMVANASGGAEARLTEARCYDPLFSPDSSLLACDATDPWIIGVVDATNGRVVTTTPDGSGMPAWSPNGRQIAYFSFGAFDPTIGEYGEYIGPDGLFVMNADGTDKRLLVKQEVGFAGKDRPPAWSSRGAIAFKRKGGIWIVNPSGRGLRRLVPADGRDTVTLAWSPDGSKLAFQHGDGDYEIFVVNADGTGLKNLTDNEKVHDQAPSWSPDGKAIAFVSRRDDDVDQLFAMRADGSGQTQLTRDGLGEYCCPLAWWLPAR